MANAIQSIKTYLWDSYGEMRKVAWPSREQVINYSIIVLALSLGMGIFFLILDYGLNLGITQLITK